MLLKGRHLQFFVHKKLDPSSLKTSTEQVREQQETYKLSAVKSRYQPLQRINKYVA